MAALSAAALALALAGYGVYELLEAPPNQVWGRTVTAGRSGVRDVALTFDDGPNPPYTGEILDVLRREHVHGTFFVVGRAVAANPAIVRRIVREGNAIGNHSWDHAHLVIETPAQIRADLARADAAVYAAAHVHTHLMRPPYGQRDFAVIGEARRAGYTVVMWSDPLPGDWDRPGVDAIVSRVVGHVKDGSIVVLHDGNRGLTCARADVAACDRSQEVAATGRIIDAVRARGFQFVTVPELIAARGATRAGLPHSGDRPVR
jgi:peptidoglycan/xylan/chitin deacetylase (PgdA/CDA1 family)